LTVFGDECSLRLRERAVQFFVDVTVAALGGDAGVAEPFERLLV